MAKPLSGAQTCIIHPNRQAQSSRLDNVIDKGKEMVKAIKVVHRGDNRWCREEVVESRGVGYSKSLQHNAKNRCYRQREFCCRKTRAEAA